MLIQPLNPPQTSDANADKSSAPETLWRYAWSMRSDRRVGRRPYDNAKGALQNDTVGIIYFLLAYAAKKARTPSSAYRRSLACVGIAASPRSIAWFNGSDMMSQLNCEAATAGSYRRGLPGAARRVGRLHPARRDLTPGPPRPPSRLVLGGRGGPGLGWAATGCHRAATCCCRV